VSRTLTFYEFFAGGGMARMGLGDRWTCLLANDFDPLKTGTYAANFGDGHLKAGDVFGLSAADLPGRADLAWASSPCQDFSLAGKRAGLAGGRSSAFFGFWTLMQALGREGRAPSVIVVENVVGMLTANGGGDFTALCRALADEGYVFGALEIDARGFVPQSRPRVFVVAVRGEAPTALLGASPYRTAAIAKAHGLLPPGLKRRWRDWRLAAPPARNADLIDLLEPDDAVAWHEPESTRRWLDLMSPAHRAQVEARRQGPRQVGAMFRRMRGGEQRVEVRFDGLAGCLRTPGGGSSRQAVVVVGGGTARTRLLNAREGARLMGLGDDYRLPAGEVAALKVIGDGVAAPVAGWLARELIEPLGVAARIHSLAAD
jgi:DNA (cytosine-5)-methyltransferase 1